MILYRSVSLQELELIYDSGMKAFPAHLSQQPIFYPVLELEYARRIASRWNAESGQSAGYVTEFKVEDTYIDRFEEHIVGESQHREFWIPAEELEEFNRHIVGHIKVLEGHFGDAFQGFIPDEFGLQGKNAAEQFTQLANSYLYKRMDFYLELKRNHKAVFLNYLFWQTYDFKNPGMKAKVLQAIKEAWLNSFPKIPLPLPPPLQEEPPPVQQTDTPASANLVVEEIAPVEQAASSPWDEPEDDEIEPEEDEADSDSLVTPVQEPIKPVKQTDSRPLIHPGQEKIILPKSANVHFLQGIELGLNGKYREALGELFKVVEAEPEHVVAHVSLGVAFHRLGEDPRALSSYETALKLDPIYAEAHYFRANILYNRGNAREAIAGYRMAIGLKPELVDAHQEPAPRDRLTDYTALPGEMYRIVKPARRILALNKLLEANPRQTDLFKERAAEYYKLRNYAQAIADYSSFLAIQPEDADVLHRRGVAYEQLGQFDRAHRDYQRAIAIHPQLSNLYIQRGIDFGRMGNYRQSVASLTEAIRLAPRNPDSYFNRGTSYFQLGDFESAIADFSMAIKLSPGDEDAYYWRGVSNEEAGRQEEAAADYRQFLVISQNAQAREEVEQRLRQWKMRERQGVHRQDVDPSDRQKTDSPTLNEPDQDVDLHSLIAALGERALRSIWFGSGAECYGENADELHAVTDQNEPIEGREILRITSGVRQTIAGDFQAFDPGADAPWIFIRAWDGSGFYVETSDPKIKERLQAQFEEMQQVEGAQPPYESLFIPV